MPAFRQHPETPFPVGVEYYRAPIPRPRLWDGDFARIRRAGLRIVRSFSYWNWMEPGPGVYELEDFDLLFDLAEKHSLSVWMDIALATHGACPEWLIREHPEMRTVNHRGEPGPDHSTPATPRGAIVHCCDHPAWRERGGALLRHVVERYRDRPSLLVWGLWDGVSPSWPRHGDGLPCYCGHTRARYKAWLRERFTLEELNARLLRRFRGWEDVEPPRSNHNVVEMLLYGLSSEAPPEGFHAAGRFGVRVEGLLRRDGRTTSRAGGTRANRLDACSPYASSPPGTGGRRASRRRADRCRGIPGARGPRGLPADRPARGTGRVVAVVRSGDGLSLHVVRDF